MLKFKTMPQIISKLLCFVFSLTLLNLSFCQIAQENFTRYTNFTIDDLGKMTFNRQILDRENGVLKDESSYKFNLNKLREFTDQNQIIRETKSFNFTKHNREDIVFMDQNATKLTFKSYFNSPDDKFYNPKAILSLYVYFFTSNYGAKKNAHSNSKLYVSYNLTGYEFCNQNTNFTNCIQTPASENKTATYKEGKYLELEFSFKSSGNQNYKVFSDVDFGITDSGDFLFLMMSEYKQDGELKLIDSKDIKLSKDKAIMRFPNFKSSVVVSSFIDTNFAERSGDDKPSEIIKYTTNSSIEISINPQGGLLMFSKADPDPTKSKFLNISLVSLAEYDKTQNALGTFNNMDHFVKNLSVYSFKTEDFKKDNYEKIAVRKSRFYLKGIPNKETVIYGDLIVFEEKGRIVIDGYRGTEIKPGDIKLHIEVQNWPFCRYNSFGSAQNCPAENPNDPPKEGVMLEMKVDITGKVAPYRIPYSEDRYSVEDLSYLFTGNVNTDDRIQKINFNNVKVDRKEKSNIINSNFPVFSKKASIEFIIDMNKPEGPHTIFIALIGLISLCSAGFIVFMCISKKIKSANTDSSLLSR